MTRSVSIIIPNVKPRPQGSKRHIGGGRSVEASKHLPAYRRAIAKAARDTMGDRPPLEGPVCAWLVFQFKRPKSHFYADGRLRHDAPKRWAVPCDRGDIDKLERAALDAMSRIVYTDDRKVARVMDKQAIFGDENITFIRVEELDN